MENKVKKALAVLLLSTFGAFGLAGCDQDGPAENFGEEVDEAAQASKVPG